MNGIMWGLFTKALTLATSTVRVSVINTSANFVVTALLGTVVFGESLPGEWVFQLCTVEAMGWVSWTVNGVQIWICVNVSQRYGGLAPDFWSLGPSLLEDVMRVLMLRRLVMAVSQRTTRQCNRLRIAKVPKPLDGVQRRAKKPTESRLDQETDEDHARLTAQVG